MATINPYLNFNGNAEEAFNFYKSVRKEFAIPEHEAKQSCEGTNHHISISAESDQEADRLFNRLSAGGKATMSMSKAFWGNYFGMLTDKFGIQWMISSASAEIRDCKEFNNNIYKI